MADIPAQQIEQLILMVRGVRVMMDSDLAILYGTSTKRLNEQVKRNLGRFPTDFMFRLTEGEYENLKSQFATSSFGHGGRRKLPLVFTEHGAIMLASVLSSSVAVSASIQVVRAFINLRQLLSSTIELAGKLDNLEKKYDRQFKVVFDAIRQLMIPPDPPRRRIGIVDDE
jgi:hypothetical protein